MTLVPADAVGGTRLHPGTQSGAHLDPEELFISTTFHFLCSDRSRLWVTETTEREAVDTGNYRLSLSSNPEQPWENVYYLRGVKLSLSGHTARKQWHWALEQGPSDFKAHGPSFQSTLPR